jgi:cytochrome oxidase assembly protein ShyY1
VLLIVVLVAFGWLGRWQLDTFEQSRSRPVSTAHPAALDRVLTPGARDAGGAADRSVVVTGTYDVRRQLLVPHREHGGRDGWLVLSPLRTAHGVLPVVRGWVPTPGAASARTPIGPVRLTGVVEPSENADDSGVDPLADLPRGQVAYVSTVLVLDAWPYPVDRLYDGYVVATQESPAPRPAPDRAVPHRPSGGVGPWRNLAYALQWWLFVGAAVFSWWSVLRRAAQDEAAAAASATHPRPGSGQVDVARDDATHPTLGDEGHERHRAREQEQQGAPE